MSGVLASVDQRTKLVGENRLELLMFKLSGHQTFAINVFKVQEVLNLPNLTAMPHRHPCICGVTHFRGQTVPVINLSQAIGMRPLEVNSESIIVVTEYNRSVQAFLVAGIEQIVNLNWEDIMPPPVAAGRAHYLTAITRYQEQIVEIIDVEKVLSDISPYSTDVSEELLENELIDSLGEKFVLVVDDSPVAIAQATGTIEKLGLPTITAPNGLRAYEMLKEWADNDPEKLKQCLLVLTDAEMPEMDGYRLTTEIRKDDRLSHFYVIMHTSLSGSFNQAMAERVGCNRLLSKFQPDELATAVLDYVKEQAS
ncbi:MULTISPECIES: chemotaxis protein [unclassified Oleiphilus]|jgi:two-component system chemotaxis response regulator CheV|nr:MULTISPECIES: chemotaxis protein [unclassified Oleiphilus]KZY45177.1 chemotaxis protein CheW [Oleiphilus sp. HI0050]KZZ35962.1 chemotaxis protein CheW [Oleiphilus sp. HI0086]KZZ40058.1 chemotaxis protein CheW [Oleiphilus sp. HI0117]KZZ56863.1 chemotaxis protein CheW [Oleiphilus sp. HI0123]